MSVVPGTCVAASYPPPYTEPLRLPNATSPTKKEEIPKCYRAEDLSTPAKAFGADLATPVTEFDEYGTELLPDARVWKAYVKETDRYDTELAQEWNDSTEVILVFAALFSAISTAFLIESSKLLSEDPAEVSKQTLVAMSRTLLAIANGTQVSASMDTSSLVETSTSFVPSYFAVCVNALWFLSLSLSLATSFIAMMAKDWCHSFVSGRTGHPFSQACRRQQKWDMIEHWKMRELLSVLPSLMHAALLLFAIGLCIYLWHVHAAIAVPVIIVTGLSIGFYALTSIGAIIVNHFPYPTIVSRLCRGSDIARQVYDYASALMLSIAFWLPVRIIVVEACMVLLVAVATVVLCLEILDSLALAPLSRVKLRLELWSQYLLVTDNILLQSVVDLPLTFVRLLVCYPADMIHHWISTLTNYTDSMLNQIPPSALGQLVWGYTSTLSVPQKGSCTPGQPDLQSRALGWLIINCEAPQSVNIALQAIAGGDNVVSRQPLLDCNATLAILRRLAAGNLYRESNAQAGREVSLYARALAFLGNSVDPGRDSAGQGDTLEGLIWNLHSETERSVSALMENSDFKPTKSNIDALRIGSTAASTSLKFLNNHPQIDIDSVLASIEQLLIEHFGGKQTIHDAALLSLVTAASLLCLVALRSPKRCTVPWICVKLVESYHDSPNSHTRLITSTAIVWMLWSDMFSDKIRLDLDSHLQSKAAIRGLIDIHSLDEVTRCTIMAFGLPTIAICKESPHLDNSIDKQMREASLKYATPHVEVFYDGFRRAVPEKMFAAYREDAVMPYLRVFHDTHNVLPIGTACSCIHFFAMSVLQSVRRVLPDPSARTYCDQIMRTCRFPTLTPMLVWMLEERNTILELENILGRVAEFPSRKIVAAGQLWLLFTLYLDSSHQATDERERLGVQLLRYDRNNPQNEIVRQRLLGEKLEQLWTDLLGTEPDHRKIWPARIMECVYQSQNSPLPSQVHRCLRDVPPEVRGLSSFTNWRPGLGTLVAEGVAVGVRAHDAQPTTRIPHTASARSVIGNNSSLSAVGEEKREARSGVPEGSTRIGDDGEGRGEGEGAKNRIKGMANNEQEVAGGNNATVVEGKGERNEGDRTDAGRNRSDDIGGGMGHESHVVVDMDKTEKAPE